LVYLAEYLRDRISRAVMYLVKDAFAAISQDCETAMKHEQRRKYVSHIGIIFDNIDHWRKRIDEASKVPGYIERSRRK